MPRKAKRNRPPKQLRQAKKRTNALMKGAMEAFNKRARRTHKDRRDARMQIQQMIEDEKEKERKWKIEQDEKAGETGILAGILMGGMTGAKLGSMSGNPWGTAIGGVVGAVGGGLYGAQEGGMADVAAVSPYAAGIANLAGQYTATQQGKERFGKLLDLYKSRGADQAGQSPAPAAVFGRHASESPFAVSGQELLSLNPNIPANYGSTVDSAVMGRTSATPDTTPTVVPATGYFPPGSNRAQIMQMINSQIAQRGGTF